MKRSFTAMRWQKWVLTTASALFMVTSGFAKAPDPAVVKAQDQRTQATVEQIKAALPKTTASKTTPADVATCYACHKDIKEFHAASKHASVNCAQCHTGADDHVAKDGKAPIGTRTDHAAC